jgi:hypothetical protein
VPTPPVDYRSLELALKVRRRPAAISRAARSRVSNDRSRRGAAWEMSNTPFFFRRLFFRASVAFARARRRRRRSSLASDTRSSALLFVCLRRHRLGKKRRRNPLGSSARASPFTRLLRLASRSSRRSGRLRVRLHSVRACDIRRGPRPNPTSPASAFACEGSPHVRRAEPRFPRSPYARTSADNLIAVRFRTRIERPVYFQAAPT